METPLNLPTAPALDAPALDATADREWDVVVIGAGPAGAVAARELARAGHKTLLVDRQAFPRGKVCGGYLNGQALSVLAELGLGDALNAARPALVHQFALHAGGRRAELELSGAAIQRTDFDAALVEAAMAAGARFAPETRAIVEAQPAERLSAADDFRQIHLAPHGRPPLLVQARVVVAADGLGHPSLVRLHEFTCPAQPGSRMGVGITLAEDSPAYAPGVLYMAVARQGYVGLVRTSGGELTLAGAFDADSLRSAGEPAGPVRSVLAGAGLPPLGQLPSEGWRGTSPLTRRSARLAATRIFLIGDAASYVEPFTGEGMAWAVSSAAAVVPVVSSAIACWDERLADAWHAAQRRKMRSGQLACRVLAAALRRPVVVGAAVNLLSRIPVLARPVVRHLGARSSQLKVLSP